MHYLEIFLPKAGMIWPVELDVLKQRWRDKKVLIALKKMVTVATDTRQMTKASKQAIDGALASIFSTAVQHPVLHVLTEQRNALDFLTALLLSNPLAAKLGEATFFRLFGALVEARLAWKANPRVPFDVNQHCLLAKSIDNFLQLAPSWTNAELDIYEAVGGYDEEESDENENEPKESTNEDQTVERMEVDDEDQGQDQGVAEITCGVEHMDIDE
ncbi:hypothetical protein F4818DRAFT_444591 [Hypoxylon cercidicola]|nr:hypothetical protein F4818DRAFT_444591 [Hypoxylon cercidicola]